VYKSDKYGFNNPNSVWESDKIDYLLIGDSFVHGSCVNQNEDFASQFRFLTGQNSVNLGMAANGPLLELASLKEYSLDKKLSSVLWFYFERNDLNDLKIEKTNSTLMKYLEENFSQNLQLKQIEIDKKLKNFIEIAEKNFKENNFSNKQSNDKFLPFKKIIRLQIVRDKTSLDRGLDFGIDKTFEQILRIANNFVKRKDGRLYFVYLPDKERYTSSNIQNENYHKRSEVLKIINKLDIPIIDIHKDFFLKEKDPLDYFAYRIYGHYSAKGYHEISKVILEKLNEK